MAFPTGRTMSGVKSATGGSTYAYRTGATPLNPDNSIGNWNTGGGDPVGYGNQKGVYDRAGNRIGGQNTDPRLTGGPNVWNPPAQSPSGYSFQFNPGGYAGGVTTGPITEIPQVPMQPPQAPMGFSLPSFLTNAALYKNPFRWPTKWRDTLSRVVPGDWKPMAPGEYDALVRRQQAQKWTDAYSGYRQAAMGYPGQQGTTNWRNTTTINKSPNGQGVVSNAGSGATYARMGNDFRSANFQPSSYPGGDGITGKDIGGGWRY